MKRTTTPSTKSLIPLANHWIGLAVPTASAAALALGLLAAVTVQAQTLTDNFNDRTDSGAQGTWTHYDLGYFTHLLSGGAIEYGTATFSFPANPLGPTSNYAYRIQAAPTCPDPIGIGPARAASFLPQPYTNRFLMAADLVSWTNPPGFYQYVGLLCLVPPNTIVPGQINGYAVTLSSSGGGELDLSAVSGELPTTIGEIDKIPLNPSHQYRLVVSSWNGTSLLATLHDQSDTNNPWRSAITDQAGQYANIPGVCGFVVEDATASACTSAGCDGAFDNYFSTTPAAGTMPATVTDLSPQPNGKAMDLFAAVIVGIYNRDTTVNANSIPLWQDGVQIPSGSLAISNYVYKPDNSGDNGAALAFDGATVYWTNNTLLPPGSTHTNVVVYSDNVPKTYSNVWTWTAAYPYLYASNSLPIGSLTLAGFDARLVQSSAAKLGSSHAYPNSVAAAQAILAGQYAVDLTSTNYVQEVAWGLAGVESGAITNFPGLCLSPATPNSFAIETFTYLQLEAGTNTFYVDSDDCVGIYSGPNLADTSTVVFQSPTDQTVSQSFQFIVESAGLYPFHIIYEQGGGGAHLVLSSVNADTTHVLLNTSGGVPAFYPLAVKSSTSVNGTYTVDAAANAANTVTTAPVSCSGTGDALNLSLSGGTVTVPISSATKFYVLDGPRAARITSSQKVGSNLVIKYGYQ
jgi:hypothetical protein